MQRRARCNHMFTRCPQPGFQQDISPALFSTSGNKAAPCKLQSNVSGSAHDQAFSKSAQVHCSAPLAKRLRLASCNCMFPVVPTTGLSARVRGCFVPVVMLQAHALVRHCSSDPSMSPPPMPCCAVRLCLPGGQRRKKRTQQSQNWWNDATPR